MSIRSQAALDVQTNINRDFETVVLTDPDENEFELQGWVKRVDWAMHPNGIDVIEKRTQVTISLSDIGSDPAEGWEVATTDVKGNAVTGTVLLPHFDRTIGFCTFIIEESS